MATRAKKLQAILKKHQITFVEDVCSEEGFAALKVPPKAAFARERILRLDQIVPSHWLNDGDHYTKDRWNEFKEIYGVPEYHSLYFNSASPDSHRASHVNQMDLPEKDRHLQKNFKAAMALVDGAMRIKGWDMISEGSYHEFLNGFLFEDWIMKATTNSHGQDQQHNSIACFQDSSTFTEFFTTERERAISRETTELEQDETKAQETQATNKQLENVPGERLKRPKPDWAFAFPVYLEPGLHADGYSLEREAEIFSLVNLAYLEELGWCSSPTARLLQNLRSRKAELLKEIAKSASGSVQITRADARLHCYPWAIIELKRPDAQGGDITEAYCQAVNACSACLTMLELLAKDYEDPIPPIVALTFIGPAVKVWLAFSEIVEGTNRSDWRTQRRMLCIWKGELTNLLDAVRLVRIKELILEWALGYFKTWVRGHLIDCYRSVYYTERKHNDTGIPSAAFNLSNLAFCRRLKLEQNIENPSMKPLVGARNSKDLPRSITPPHIRLDKIRPGEGGALNQQPSPTPSGMQGVSQIESVVVLEVENVDQGQSTCVTNDQEFSVKSLTDSFRALTASTPVTTFGTPGATSHRFGMDKGFLSHNAVVPTSIAKRKVISEDGHSKSKAISCNIREDSDQDTTLIGQSVSSSPFRNGLYHGSPNNESERGKIASERPSNESERANSESEEADDESEEQDVESEEADEESEEADEESEDADEESEDADEEGEEANSVTDGVSSKAEREYSEWERDNNGCKTRSLPESPARKSRRTLLHEAATNGNIRLAKSYVKQGADVNATDENSRAPIHCAVVLGHFDVAEFLLLQKDIIVNVKAEKGWTPLHFAVETRHRKLVKLLIKNKADVNMGDSGGWTPLHLAVDNGDLRMTRILVGKRAKVNKPEAHGWTPLLVAVNEEHLDIAEFLIKSHAKLNAKNDGGKTALHLATKKGHLRMVKLLVEGGANVNSKTPDDWTALDLADYYHHAYIARFLCCY